MKRFKGSVLGLALLLLFLPLGAFGQDSTKSDEGIPVENCDVLRKQRKENCKMAYHICYDVYKIDALNQIKSCAYYSQECYEIGQREEEVCGDAQYTLKNH